MKAIKTILAFMLMALFTVAGAQAAPVTIEDLTIEDDNGDFLALVDLANGPTGDEFTEVTIGIEELGTTHEEIVRVPNNTSGQTETFDLRDVIDDYEALKRGETYTLEVSTDDGSTEKESFLFKTQKDTDGLDMIVERVDINSVTVADDDVLQVVNGEEVTVDLQLFAQENLDDARFRVFVEGYEHGSIMESTDIFSVKEGRTYTEELTIQLPDDMDSQKDYKLRIEGANDLSGLTYKEYTVYVDTDRNRVDILDLVTTPSSGVEPGQNLISNVRLKNRGQESQDSVKVSVNVPELGISESSYVSNVDFDDVVTSDDMLLRVPDDAKSGSYEAEVELSYNDGYEETTQTYPFRVLEQREVEEKNLLVEFDENIEFRAGEENTFDVVVGNPNTDSKPISISGDSAWADVSASPSLSMISGGEDKTFSVSVTPKSEVSGENTLTLNIMEGNEIVDTIEVDTYVEKGEDTNLLNILLAALIVLGLIILVALVVVIARRRNDTSEEITEDFDSEEYY